MKAFWKAVVILTLGMMVSSSAYAAEEDEVTTLVGSGAAGQGTFTMDHPRHIALQGGNTYFVDGDHNHAKLRMYNGKELSTVVDLAKSPQFHRSKMFVDTGLAAAKDTLYVSDYQGLYKVVGHRITAVAAVNDYIKEQHIEYIYRMKAYQNTLILMGWKKAQSGTYIFIQYNPDDNSVSPLLDNVSYDYSPNTFYPDKDGILVTTTGGYIIYEKYSPRKTINVESFQDGNVLDAWTTASGYLHYSIVTAGGTENKIMARPRSSEDEEDNSLVAGGTRGYQDGVMDEAEMDFAQDFTWDGTGYIFSDEDNNMIRKLWVDDPPTNVVQ